MNIFNNIEGLRQFREATRTSLTIGNFDGCHVGHQALISSVVARSKNLSTLATVLTFDPHPIEALGIVEKIPRIQSLADRLSTLAELGVNQVVVFEFDHAMSQLTARDFAKSILIDGAGIRSIAIGEDFRFGHKRAGDIDLLRELGGVHGFEVDSIPPVCVKGEVASSTRVRKYLIDEGELGVAREVLGRNWSFVGHVKSGDQIGRTIGFPTANLDGIETLIPKHGVYAVRVNGRHPDIKDAPAVMNIGVRPTMGGRELRVEVHILDRTGLDLYGQTLSIEPIRYLRPEIKFSGREQLMKQIDIDCDVARELF